MLTVIILILGAGCLVFAGWLGLFTGRGWSRVPARLPAAHNEAVGAGAGERIAGASRSTTEGMESWLFWACLAVAFATLATSAVGAGIGSAQAGAAGAAADSVRAKAQPMVTGYALAAVVGLVGMLGIGLRVEPPVVVPGGWPRLGPDWARLRVRHMPLGFAWSVGTIFPVLALGVISASLHRLLAGVPPAPIAHPTLELLAKNPGDAWSLALMAGAVIGAPVVEEIIFRAGVQTALLRATGSRAVAIGLATTAFLSVHLGLPWHTLLPLGGLSIALGMAYERTRSLAVPVVMHAAYNGLNVAMVVWG